MALDNTDGCSIHTSVCLRIRWDMGIQRSQERDGAAWVRRTQEMLDIMYMGTEFGKPYDWSKEAEQDLIKKGESNV